MMRFNRPSEPDEFDQKVRQPGNLWLEKNPDLTKKLPDYWSRFKPHLADGFHNLCGYSVMYEPVGTVDHYLSRKNYRHLAYQWSNYRFVSGWINSSKQEIDDTVLDPFEVEDNWFEIQLSRYTKLIAHLANLNSLSRKDYRRLDYAINFV